jgi:hypothetical protein
LDITDQNNRNLALCEFRLLHVRGSRLAVLPTYNQSDFGGTYKKTQIGKHAEAAEGLGVSWRRGIAPASLAVALTVSGFLPKSF